MTKTNFYLPLLAQNRNINNCKRYEVLKKYNWKCAICGKPLKYSKHHSGDKEVAQIDHIYPYSKRDTFNGYLINDISNLQALCSSCNLKKSNKLLN